LRIGAFDTRLGASRFLFVFTRRDWTDATGRSSGAGQKRKPRQSGATLHKFGKSAKTSNSYLCEKCSWNLTAGRRMKAIRGSS
jgi:hypothetical protein